MKKRSKRYRARQTQSPQGLATLDTALLSLESSTDVRFDESVEAHYVLASDKQGSFKPVRFTVRFPHDFGKSMRIAVVCGEVDMEKAQSAGADLVGGSSLLDSIGKGEVDFDLLIATPDMMKEVAKVSKILGPKGLMPNPKNGTVTHDLKETVSRFKTGEKHLSSESKSPCIHATFGTLSLGVEKLRDNFLALHTAVVKSRPSKIKGEYLKKVVIKSTMGPSVVLDLAEIPDAT